MRSSSLATKFNSDAPLQKRLLLYFIVVLSSIGLLLWQWPQARFDASVLSMLPSHSVKALPQELEDGLLERLDRVMPSISTAPRWSPLS